MKKLLTAISFILLSVFTSACSQSVVISDKPQIYTSFYAIYDFVTEIAGDKAEVYNIVPTGTEPHDWEPTVQDMAKLNSADVLFYNGLGMEHWIDKVQNSLLNSDTEFVQLSEGVDVDEKAGDPHIWLDPSNVKIMCSNIYNTLCEIDPDNKALYEANYNNYIVQLSSLDTTYKNTIANLPGNNRTIVVSHEAYSYLCNAYGLNQVSIDGISADSEPSPEKMMELISFIKDNNINYIFYEELLSQKTAQTLADETGAQLLSLNPFEGLTEEEIANGENYISVMLRNLENIKTALQ